MVNPFDFGGHSSKVNVTMGIIDKCGVHGDATLRVVIFEIYSVRSASRDTIAGVLVFQSCTIMRNIIEHSILSLVPSGFCKFFARLHFSAEELLLYPQRQRRRRRPHTKC